MLLGIGCAIPPEEPQDFDDFNVVLIVVDTLRADHLGCYGYARNTSPEIDSLAESSIIFEMAFSNSSITPESISSLFTGRRPSHGGHTGLAARPHDSFTTLAEYLQRNGYRTGFFTSNLILKHAANFQGFDEVEFVIPGSATSGNNLRLSKRAIQFVKSNRRSKFFMYVHFMDPHGPYEPPPKFYRRFARHEIDEPIKLYNEVRSNMRKLTESGFGPGDPRFEDMIDRYDAEIADTDRAIGKLLKAVKRLGLSEKTLVILTADHGEEFLEHGYVEHGWTLFRESIHVPLIVHQPAKLAPRKIRRPVELVDLFPTLIELLQFDYEGQGFDGAPFITRTGDVLDFDSPERPIIAEMLHGKRGDHRVVIFEGWKLMHVRHPLSIQEREEFIGTEEAEFWDLWNGKLIFERDTWSAPAYEALFNIAKDPSETTNLIDEYPDKAEELRAILRKYKVEVQRDAPIKRTQDSTSVPEDKSFTEKLRALGYVN